MKDITAVKEAIKASLSLGDIMRSKGQIRGLTEEEQFRCPFHGADNKPSARYYSRTDSAYCWVCKKSWDVISYTQQSEEMSFPEAIKYLVKLGRVDLKKIPDVLERNAENIHASRKTVKVSSRGLETEKLKKAILLLRDRVPLQKYVKLVYAYLIIKNTVEDKEFPGLFEKLKQSVIRIAKGAANG